MSQTTSEIMMKDLQWSSILMEALLECNDTRRTVYIDIATDAGEALLNVALDQLLAEGDDRANQIEVRRLELN